MHCNAMHNNVKNLARLEAVRYVALVPGNFRSCVT